MRIKYDIIFEVIRSRSSFEEEGNLIFEKRGKSIFDRYDDPIDKFSVAIGLFFLLIFWILPPYMSSTILGPAYVVKSSLLHIHSLVKDSLFGNGLSKSVEGSE